jgi:hypothetical protein
MKNIFSLITLVSFTALLFTSCEKEDPSVSTANPGEENSLFAKPVIYYATWDEWGRARKGCDGWGLCNYTDCWLCDDGELMTNWAPVIYDDITGAGTMNISLRPEVDIENNAIVNHLPFHVDMNIVNPGSTLHAGTYQFDPSVGEHGGYKISITVNIGD